MKKALIFIVTLGFIVTLSACTTADLNNLNNLLQTDVLSSSESLSTLAYLSGSLLDIETTSDGVASNNLVKLSDTDETEIETELDLVNEYMDRLKEFMDNGTASFGNVSQQLSDNPDYQFMLTFTVNEEVFNIYYNVDIVTQEISGIMLIGDVEYVIEVSNTLSDSHELDDEDESNDIDQEDNGDIDQEDNGDINQEDPSSAADDTVDSESAATKTDDEKENDDDTVDTEDEDHDDLDSEDTEEKMVLTAYNGEDYVKVIYKVETSVDETETKFTLISNIAGVEREVFMKISVEDNEYKITIEENGDKFTFKKEVEDGETSYKLKYDVNGVEGEVKIIEKVNDLGETVYEYKIKEGDKSSTVEKEEPDHHSDDHDDQDDEETEGENIITITNDQLKAQEVKKLKRVPKVN